MYRLISVHVLKCIPSLKNDTKNPKKVEVNPTVLMHAKTNTVIRVRYGAVMYSGRPSNKETDAIVMIVVYMVFVTRKTLPPAHPRKAPKLCK